MKHIDNFISEKLHLHKGGHLIIDENIKFPIDIKFWWGRSYERATMDDLNDLSDIQRFGISRLDMQDENNKDFYGYEITIETLRDLYAFMGCMCWVSVMDKTFKKENIDDLEDVFIEPDKVKKEILERLNLEKINDAFQISLKKFPKRN